ncbi:MAG: error-prone DNA polymerase [Cellvibrio sp. 79]|nr:MAG: error-prone DNA polymerase [Cellvibrio sp. 79]
MNYTHLHTITNFTFLSGASHPQEMVTRAAELGYSAIAITDECSLAGVVKAFSAAQKCGIELIIGSHFFLSNGITLIAIAPTRIAYAELSGFITLARRRADKGNYEAHIEDLRFRLQHCLLIWLCDPINDNNESTIQLHADYLTRAFKDRLWLGINHQLHSGEQQHFERWQQLGKEWGIPLVAAGQALMHSSKRKMLLDSLTAIRLNTEVQKLGTQTRANSEAYLKTLGQLEKLYPSALLEETERIREQCNFSMEELQYQYPRELVPAGFAPDQYLRHLVRQGEQQRYPQGTPPEVTQLIEKELGLIIGERYEFFFLTVYDIVEFARSQDILCQGRGSAANSVVCYCLGITEIAPGQINVLFERFISKERNEPPDIDVDFEHARREEVIQYIYQKYSRERAALAATVITYRRRSAVRDLGKALGFDPIFITHLASSIAWWDERTEWEQRLTRLSEQLRESNQAFILPSQQKLHLFFDLVNELRGFPRHLSQHVGGFVIAQDRISDLVPIENASMPERTIIQWDKEDLETMRLLKVDVLALGMLTALKKTLRIIQKYQPGIQRLADIPAEDDATYKMLRMADSVGVFQVESRAQMSMLPRLKPETFYDLVIQIAIVRPGPIQGGMVHPYLQRRNKKEKVTYEHDDLEPVLKSTLGIPIFQEQAIRLAMVAAGFSGGRADELRRSMASWGKNSDLEKFEEEFITGMLTRNYSLDFAVRLFEQIKGFGGYGFPESHSASFALLCYASSWCKRHHPAAFYCALLNSQPMGFYSPSQLIQDAKRHGIVVLPVDINRSEYENQLEKTAANNLPTEYFPNPQPLFAIRLGFCQISSLNITAAQQIARWRGNKPFTSLENLSRRTPLTATDLGQLAAADAFAQLTGDRHESRWQAAALKPYISLLENSEDQHDLLSMPAPSLEKDMQDDYTSLGLSLRTHPMALLRNQSPFNRCKTQRELASIGHGRFVRVAGLVTGRQRPGTAKGSMFVTLEDETGNINVIVWQQTQVHFREPLLNAQLLMIKGVLEINATDSETPVIHLVAGHLQDYTHCLKNLSVNSRDFH